MGEDNAAAVLASHQNSNRVTARDVKRMRAAVYADGIVSRAEAEMIFGVANSDTETCPAWHAFFVEAVTDHIVHQALPAGYMSEDNADWLIGAIAKDGIVETMTELELLVTVLEKAKASPERLVAFALRQVADAVIDNKGPLARVPGRMPNVVDRWEVELLRRILYAFGGAGNIAITRAEAEVLFAINDRTVEEMNHASWNELFVKAMASFVMGSSGYEAPTREEALRRDSFFDRADVDVGAFFAKMVSGGMSAIFDAYAEPSGADSDWDARILARDAAARRAEAIDQDEAAWLAERMGGSRLLHDNERALLSLIKTSSPSIHPALKPLIDKVA